MEPKKRGRPKKILLPEPTEKAMLIAETLAKHCGIPGCIAKNHLEEANEILGLVGK